MYVWCWSICKLNWELSVFNSLDPKSRSDSNCSELLKTIIPTLKYSNLGVQRILHTAQLKHLLLVDSYIFTRLYFLKFQFPIRDWKTIKYSVIQGLTPLLYLVKIINGTTNSYLPTKVSICFSFLKW